MATVTTFVLRDTHPHTTLSPKIPGTGHPWQATFQTRVPEEHTRGLPVGARGADTHTFPVGPQQEPLS